MSDGANFLMHSIFVIQQAGYNSLKVSFFGLISLNKLIKWPNEAIILDTILVKDLVDLSIRIIKISHSPHSF